MEGKKETLYVSKNQDIIAVRKGLFLMGFVSMFKKLY